MMKQNMKEMKTAGLKAIDDKNSIVLLELSDAKENYEIVNYHYISDDGVNRKERIDNKIKS